MFTLATKLYFILHQCFQKFDTEPVRQSNNGGARRGEMQYFGHPLYLLILLVVLYFPVLQLTIRYLTLLVHVQTIGT